MKTRHLENHDVQSVRKQEKTTIPRHSAAIYPDGVLLFMSVLSHLDDEIYKKRSSDDSTVDSKEKSSFLQLDFMDTVQMLNDFC